MNAHAYRQKSTESKADSKDPEPKRGLSISWVNAESLPSPYRENLGDQMRELKPDWQEFRANMTQRRQAVVDALTADPFELDAVRAAFAADRGVKQELENQGTELLLEQVGLMTPEERAVYAENLLAARGKPGKWAGKRD